MRIDKFTYMDRETADINVLTRFLCNGRIVGNGMIKKVPGYDTFTTSKNLYPTGTLDLDEKNGTFFRHDKHGSSYVQQIYIIENNTMYLYNQVSGYWDAIVWKGSGSASLPSARFWRFGNKMYVASGTAAGAIASVYEYINREKDTDLNGYFNNLEEYVGFWFGPEEITQFDLSTVYNSINWKVINLNKELDPTLRHFMMGIYNCSGQKSIFKEGSSLLIEREQVTGDKYPVVEIRQDFSDLDKRVTDIDIYGAIERMDSYIKRSSKRPFRRREPLHMDRLRSIVYQEESELDWRFLNRISINHDTIVQISSQNIGQYVDGTNVKVATTSGAATLYCTAFVPFNANDCLNNYFYFGFKAHDSDTWSYSLITDVQENTPSTGWVQFTVADAGSFESGKYYTLKIVMRWQLVSGDIYKIYVPWLRDTDLGDPFDTDQEYSIKDEYYPQYLYSAVQNRRVFRLGAKTDEEHRDMLLWSEADKPQVVPNGNYLLLKTKTDESAKGLETVKGGLLALYEYTCHYIRMTGEPVEYDAEEGCFEEGCIASRSIVNIDEMVFWCGYDGIKAFDGSRIIDLTKDVLRTDYKSLIASEYSGGSSSYEGICGGYCQKEKIICWFFPNSSATIDGIAVNGIGYDLERGGFFFILSDQDFRVLFNDYTGKLYGISGNGAYELFSDSPDETSQLVWKSGVISDPEMGHIIIKKIRLRYYDIPAAVKVYTDNNLVMNEALDTKTSLGYVRRMLSAQGEELYMEYHGVDGTALSKLASIDIEMSKANR